ncbi:hypothetical protein BJ912DRAFT_807026, partial [Pholiota molesta]
IHKLGKMDIKCSKCSALHWIDERLAKSSKRNPQFGMCCFNGKIELPNLENPPPELSHLLTDTSPASKSFRSNIRQYNNALAMTSLGVKIDDSLNRQGGGPYVFKIQGKLSHLAGSLLPAEGAVPSYAQLYIYDGSEALNYRMNHPANRSLNRATMQTLQDMLHRKHPAVQLYKQAFELTRNFPADQQHTIALRYDSDTDRRRYNLPTTSNEVAVILPGDGDRAENTRDIILHRKAGEGLRRISELHPLYHSLHYVLLFPTGQLGWHPKIPFR